MDVADPRPVESLSRRQPALLAAPPVVFALLVGAIIYLVLQLHPPGGNERARQQALAAARAEALNVTTIDYRTAARDLNRILSLATGQVRAQFLTQQKQFPDVLRKAKSVSRGQVLTAALTSINRSTARALVALDATVSNAATAKAGQSNQVKHYRMVMTLRRLHGRWLVSDLAFAGLPQ